MQRGKKREPRGHGKIGAKWALLAYLAPFLLGCGLVPDGCGNAKIASKKKVNEGHHGELKAPAERKLIDAHTHLHPYAMDRIVRIMDQVGIETMVNLSGGHPWDGVPKLWSNVQTQHPGRFVHCMNIDWRQLPLPDFGERMGAALEVVVNKFDYRCLKLSKALGLAVQDPQTGNLLQVDDTRLDPLWEAAGRLNVPVYIHTGDPKAFFEPITPDNERYEELRVHPSWSFADRSRFPSRQDLLAARDRLVERHPNTLFVGVHFGNNPEDIDYVAANLARYPNFYVDLSARIGEIGRHPPDKVRNLMVKYQDRILFGTDIGIGPKYLVLGSGDDKEPDLDDVPPFYQDHFDYLESNRRNMAHPIPIQGPWKVDAIALPASVQEKIYYLNAKRLVHLGSKRQGHGWSRN